MKPAVISPSAVARRLGVSVEDLRDMAARGEVPCERIGHNSFRFIFDDVLLYLETRRIGLPEICTR